MQIVENGRTTTGYFWGMCVVKKSLLYFVCIALPEKDLCFSATNLRKGCCGDDRNLGLRGARDEWAIMQQQTTSSHQVKE